MIRVALHLLIATALVFSAYEGWVVGYVTDYVNGTSKTDLFFMLENGTLIPLTVDVPWELVGSGVRVKAEVVDGKARLLLPAAEPLAAPPPQSPVRGNLLVTVVAAKFKDVPDEPYNYSYIHDVVFGPHPSLRDFWEYVSRGAIKIKPYYVHWGWITLPRTTSDYCLVPDINTVVELIAEDVINSLYQRGVQLPDYSYLIIVLNKDLPCDPGTAGRGTIRMWQFSTPYGIRNLAVSWIYHYADWLRSEPDVQLYMHEFGHNLGLRHSGTSVEEYDNVWDVMGGIRLWHYLDSWLGQTEYGVVAGLAVPHGYYLGWYDIMQLNASAYVSSFSGVYWHGPDGVYTAEYKCAGKYESYLDFCGVVFHKLRSSTFERWVYFTPVMNVTTPWSSGVNFLDVGQSAWVGGVRISVVWRNSTHAKIVSGYPTLDQIIGANATFVVGARAATIDSVAAVYARAALSPTATRTRNSYFLQPLFAYLDDESFMAQVRWYYDSSIENWMALYVPYPGVVVSVGGPFANRLTYALNPPNRPGAGGLPFYFDTSVGGIKDAVTGAVWTSNAAVVAAVVNGSRVYLLVWGIGGEDTRRAAQWLAECAPPPARAVVIDTASFRVLASWPLGFEGPSYCPGRTYAAAAVVGAGAASIDAVGAAMAVGGLGVLDSEANSTQLPPLVFSVGGPLANRFTAVFNPVGRVGYGGLPFYYDPSVGGIRDGRTGAVLCVSSCFVVAKLQWGRRAVVLAWGLGGDDTRAAAAYVHYYGKELLEEFGNAAVVVRWSWRYYQSYKIGIDFYTIAKWP
ncbi:hypothetical protein PAE0478 [Pyrobaculum aerophilum str. IM2]|uniref:Peptidase M11 gametolysin domain-containing protein n=2 Tax=Pyrobaculum aerophilum TaxID=13773 RepID=Q8ZZ23_PYRAE|nr:hypothetical protein [Pyrobaculum aerophilum]AAL62818.1 hypothetical protein PAE0478 [Pyrobaculum aerophilum str. IM2]HII46841.1 hypothetical protein [Pyrobaculum aerophilum]